MLTLSGTQVWVHDQDEALAFWTEKIGFEVKEDVTVAELGNFHWLSVGPRDGTTGLVLMPVPGPPVMDDATKRQVEDLMGRGYATAQFFTTTDAMAEYERLVAAGVDVMDAPTQQPYGIDFGFRDPSGNSYRVAQRQRAASGASPSAADRSGS